MEMSVVDNETNQAPFRFRLEGDGKPATGAEPWLDPIDPAS
jgi:hypothetical protein